jgi:hypothetical protein
VENVVPDAIHSLHAQIIDRNAPGDRDLAARLLERSGVLDGGGCADLQHRGRRGVATGASASASQAPTTTPHCRSPYAGAAPLHYLMRVSPALKS